MDLKSVLDNRKSVGVAVFGLILVAGLSAFLFVQGEVYVPGKVTEGDTISVEATNLCTFEFKAQEHEHIYNSPAIWMQIENPNDEIVMSKAVDDWYHFEEETCYDWSGEVQLPDDIGTDYGEHRIKVFPVADNRDESWCEEGDKANGGILIETCVERLGLLGDPRTATFIVEKDGSADQPPSASFDAPDEVRVGENIQLSASGSSDDEGIARYEWTIDGDLYSGQYQDFDFGAPGTKVIELKVTDAEGQSDTYTDEVYVRDINEEETNQEPVAEASAGKDTIQVGDCVKISGSGSYDPDGSIARFEWGNGRLMETWYYCSDSSGSKTFSLTVEDDEGGTDTASVTVDVERPPNNAPEISGIEIPGSAKTGEDVEVSVDASDSNGDTLYYSWSNGDSGSSTTYSWTTSGTKEISVEVSDKRDSVSRSASISVEQSNSAPAAGIDLAESGLVGESVTLDGSSSTDDNEVQKYVWTVAGQELTGETASVEFDSAGIKTVKLKVLDENGASDTAQDTIYIQANGDGSGDGSTGDADDDGNQSGTDSDSEQGFWAEFWSQITSILTFSG